MSYDITEEDLQGILERDAKRKSTIKSGLVNKKNPNFVPVMKALEGYLYQQGINNSNVYADEWPIIWWEKVW